MRPPDGWGGVRPSEPYPPEPACATCSFAMLFAFTALVVLLVIAAAAFP